MMETKHMSRPKDQVRAAYYDELGTAFGKKVRSRVHWIIRETKGDQILDIGCSGGLVPILLGREGKQVFGIDVSPEAIEEAKNALNGEADSVRELVRLEEANLMTFSTQQQFDTVLMTEVLEHIGEPERFVQKACSFLKPGGRLVVTVPFGVNDYADHKRTYYLRHLLEQLTPYGTIEQLERIDKWLGVTVTLHTQKQTARTITEQEIKWLEAAFEAVERLHLAEIVRLKQVNKKWERQQQKQHDLEEEQENLLSERDLLSQQLLEKDESIEILTQQYRLVLERYEGALASNLDIMEANAEWKSKYRSLANSKLGKLIVRYWKLRRKLKKRVAKKR
jgi:2-polyprenyl-6-hydroxyphenyl methylase/3-demethylubiquinone-9 3-methyltransferase